MTHSGFLIFQKKFEDFFIRVRFKPSLFKFENKLNLNKPKISLIQTNSSLKITYLKTWALKVFDWPNSQVLKTSTRINQNNIILTNMHHSDIVLIIFYSDIILS